MSMKEAFDTFFEEMDRNSMKVRGKLPSLPFVAGPAEKTLFLEETRSKSNWAVWRPRLQTDPVSFTNIEKEFGFEIHPQLKEYLTTYWFRRLEARMVVDGEDISFALNSILPGTNFNEWLRRMKSDEETHYLNDCVYFILATYCNIDGVDSFLVEFNNDTGEVTAVEVGDGVSIKLADSLDELLNTMKGQWIEE